MNLRTLVIAPSTDLPAAPNEVEAVVNLIHPDQVMLGQEVTATAVLTAVIQRGPWDRLWFITHGDPTGVVLSDGVLETSLLVSAIRTAQTKELILNTCDSKEIALAISQETGCAVVATVVAVPDRLAYFTGAQLAYWLSRDFDLSDAYEMAKPGGNRAYIYIPGRASSEKLDAMDRQREGSRGEPFNDLANEVRRLAAIIDGDQKWRQRGLVNTIESLEKTMEVLSDTVTNLDRTIGFLRILFFWTLGVNLLVVIMIVFAFLWSN